MNWSDDLDLAMRTFEDGNVAVLGDFGTDNLDGDIVVAIRIPLGDRKLVGQIMDRLQPQTVAWLAPDDLDRQ